MTFYATQSLKVRKLFAEIRYLSMSEFSIEAWESVRQFRRVRMLLQNQFFFMLASKMCWVCWVLLLFAGCWYIHKKYCRPIIWIYYSLLDSHAELAAELTLFEFLAYRSLFLSDRICGSIFIEVFFIDFFEIPVKQSKYH